MAAVPSRIGDVLPVVVVKLVAHPLLDDGALLPEASSVLVAIAGSRSLTLGEVNWVAGAAVFI